MTTYQGEKLFGFLCSGLMPVLTERGQEMRKVARVDLRNMQRYPEVDQDEFLVTHMDGSCTVVRTGFD